MDSTLIQIGTPEEEDFVIGLMMRAVAQYAKERNLNIEGLRETKLQKILCKAAGDLNLPITRSWYMRGEYVSNPIIKTSNLRNYYNKRDAGYLTSKQNGIYKTLYNAISSSIDEFWPIETRELLLRLYSRNAPERYKRLYLTNNYLLSTNNLLKDSLASNEVSLLNYSIGRNYNYYSQASKNVSKIHVELASKPEFENIIDDYINLTDLLEGVYLRLDILYNLKKTISHDVKDFFIRLNGIYYSDVWKYPALIISKNTMIGIQKEKNIAWCESKLEYANKNMNETIENIETEANDLDLIPTSKDLEIVDRELYASAGENASQCLKEFWNIYNKV
jgi:hypothetical protein